MKAYGCHFRNCFSHLIAICGSSKISDWGTRWYCTSFNFVVTRFNRPPYPASKSLFYKTRRNRTLPVCNTWHTLSYCRRWNRFAFFFFWSLRARNSQSVRFLGEFILLPSLRHRRVFRLNGNWSVCLPRRIIHGKLVFVTTNDKLQTLLWQVILLYRWRSFLILNYIVSHDHDRRRKKKRAIPRQGSEFQSEPVFRWPIATSMSPHEHRISRWKRYRSYESLRSCYYHGLSRFLSRWSSRCSWLKYRCPYWCTGQ